MQPLPSCLVVVEEGIPCIVQPDPQPPKTHQPAPWILFGVALCIVTLDIWLEVHGYDTISQWMKHFDQHHHWFKWAVGGFLIVLWGHFFKGWFWN